MQMHHDAGSIDPWGQLAPEVTLPILIISFLYLRQRKNQEISFRQAIFFSAGILSALAVIITPIGVKSMEYFSLHMIQHITLMMVSGPLLVLGTPAAFNPKNKIFVALAHPVFSWVAYALLMIGVHLPSPHSFIMENPWAHTYIEIPLYLTLPYLFYFNLLDRKLIDRKVSPAISVIALFLMMIPETLTGFFIYTAPGSLYNEMYSLNDQRRGGTLMWSGAMIIDTIWMAFAVSHWIKSEEHKSHAIDLEIAAENGK